jgi:hypothetical protein
MSALDHLQQKWSECYRENQALLREIEWLKGEMAEIRRKQKIALNKIYANGFEVGKVDATTPRGA